MTTTQQPQQQQQPSSEDVAWLKESPSRAEAFDKAFGQGASAQHLNLHNPITDIGRGLVHGVLRAVDEVSDSIVSGVNAVAGEDTLPQPIHYSEKAEEAGLERPNRLTGQLAEGLAQFGTGFIGAGRLFKAFGWAAKGVKGAAVKAAAADGIAFDPYENTVAEAVNALAEEHEYLRNPLTAFLASDDTDGELEARLKNVVEGAMVGYAAERSVRAVMSGFRYFRAKARGDAQGMQQAVDEAAAHTANDGAGPPQDLAAPPTAPQGTPTPTPKVEALVEHVAGQEARSASAADAAAAKGAAQPAPQVHKPGVKVDEEAIKRISESVDETLAHHDINARKTGWGFNEGPNLPQSERMFNWETIAAPDDVKALMDDGAARLAEHNPRAAQLDTQSWRTVDAQFAQLARMAGEDPVKAMMRAQATAADGRTLAARTHFNVALATSFSDRVTTLTKMLRSGVTTDSAGKVFGSVDAVRAERDRLIPLWQESLAYAVAARKSAGRNLNYLKRATKVTPKMAEAVSKLAKSGDSEALDQAILDAVGNPEAVAAAVTKPLGTYRRYWLNSILSGPKTHVVNFATNGLNSVGMVVEKGLGGALRGDLLEVREAGDVLAGFVTEGWDALKFMAEAFKKHENVLDFAGQGSAGHAQNFKPMPISEAVTAFREHRLTDALKGAFDNLVTLPTRSLLASDELFQQLNYRASVRAKALREGRQMKLADADLETHVRQRMGEAFDADGGAAMDAMGNLKFGEAFDRSRRAAFKQDLGEGTLGHTLQVFTSKHPAASFILPFIKTPTNVIRATWHRTPGLRRLSKAWQEEWHAADEVKRGEMQAQMIVGSTLWMGTLSMASNGSITGGGPSDPVLARQLKSTGWQPYSLVRENADGTKSYYAFNRLDPTGLFLGLAADMAELHAMSQWRPDDEVYMAAAMSVARNLSNKTYFRGIFDAVNALGDPDRSLSKFAKNFAGSFVPSALNPNLNADDPLHEVRSIIDAVRNRTPGLGEKLDPQRNILGDVIYTSDAFGPDFASPVAHRKTKGDAVGERMFALMFETDDRITYPPREESGVSYLDAKNDKGQSAYDRLLELTADPTQGKGGRPLRDALAETLGRIDAAGNVPREAQMTMVRAVYGKYRGAAKAQLFREFPQLHRDLIAAKVLEDRGIALQ